MFRALRMQMDELGLEPDYKVNGLSALPGILSMSQN
jgi:2-haloacid dehalogenase